MIGGLRKAPWAIQRVLVSKDETVERANEMAEHVLHKKIKGIPVGNFYHFRNMPKTAFVKGTFRTKQIKAGLKLVFGELKPEHAHLSGAGIFDFFKRGYEYIKDKISPVTAVVSNAVDTVKEKVSSALTIKEYSKNTTANLAKYGSQRVTGLTIYRKPVEDWINKVFQGVSVGQWETLKKKYGIDKFFHLTLVCTVDGDKKVAVEKLEVISVNENVPSGEGVETHEVPLKGKSFTISNTLELARAKVGDATFFSYDALGGNNCQNFVALLLEVQGLYGPSEKAFVYQDIKSLVAELPPRLLTFSKATTDLGALFNKATGIGGVRNRLNGRGDNYQQIVSLGDRIDQLNNRVSEIERTNKKMSGGSVGWTPDGYKDQTDLERGVKFAYEKTANLLDPDREGLENDKFVQQQRVKNQSEFENRKNELADFSRDDKFKLHDLEMEELQGNLAQRIQATKDIADLKNKYKGGFMRAVPFTNRYEDYQGGMLRRSASPIRVVQDMVRPESVAPPVSLCEIIERMRAIQPPLAEAVVDFICDEGCPITEMCREPNLDGGNKSSGFIRAIMAGKNVKHPEQFKNYNTTGFEEQKLSKLTKDIAVKHQLDEPTIKYEPQAIVDTGRKYKKDVKYKEGPKQGKIKHGKDSSILKNTIGTYLPSGKKTIRLEVEDLTGDNYVLEFEGDSDIKGKKSMWNVQPGKKYDQSKKLDGLLYLNNFKNDDKKIKGFDVVVGDGEDLIYLTRKKAKKAPQEEKEEKEFKEAPVTLDQLSEAYYVAVNQAGREKIKTEMEALGTQQQIKASLAKIRKRLQRVRDVNAGLDRGANR
jgi:hypothetical protein